MISVFGDESSSSEFATYGLFAVRTEQLPIIARLVEEAATAMKATKPEPLHCKALFHNDRRAKSAFAAASRSEVEHACSNLIARLSLLECAFYLGRTSRKTAPKVAHVALIDPNNKTEIVYGRLKLELEHLQWFAYGAAAAYACQNLKEPAAHVIADYNKSVIQWFNERRKAGRLLELMFMESTFPSWPTVTLADDAAHPGIQIADVLTYYATKQFTDERFARTFDLIRPKSTFLIQDFDEQIRRPYVPPPGVTVREISAKR